MTATPEKMKQTKRQSAVKTHTLILMITAETLSLFFAFFFITYFFSAIAALQFSAMFLAVSP